MITPEGMRTPRRMSLVLVDFLDVVTGTSVVCTVPELGRVEAVDVDDEVLGVDVGLEEVEEDEDDEDDEDDDDDDDDEEDGEDDEDGDDDDEEEEEEEEEEGVDEELEDAEGVGVVVVSLDEEAWLVSLSSPVVPVVVVLDD